MVPGATNYFGTDAQVQPMKSGGNLNAGYNAIQAIDNVAAESSQDKIRQGVASGGKRTAREVMLSEQNAAIQLGVFGTMVSAAVKQLGDLMVDLIIQHFTVGEVEEITAGQIRMKFRTFLMPNKARNGRKITKKIIFTNEFTGQSMTDDKKLKESFKLFKEGGALEQSMAIYKVNPQLFANLDFLIRVDADSVGPKNEELERAFKLEGYDRLINNPHVDQVEVTRDFLVEPISGGETEKYMKSAQSIGIIPEPETPQGAGIAGQVTAPAKSLSALTQA